MIYKRLENENTPNVKGMKCFTIKTVLNFSVVFAGNVLQQNTSKRYLNIRSLDHVLMFLCCKMKIQVCYR